MKMKKKIFSFFLVVAIVFSGLQLPNITANAEDTENTTAYLRFRYEREDKTYNDEDMFIVSFDDSKEAVKFNLSDDEGKYAVVEVPAGTKKIAYKVANREEQIYDAADLMNKEILTSVDNDGNSAEKISELYKDKDDITVRLHYFRYDENYKDWDLWSWFDGANGAAFKFTKEDFKDGKTSQVTEIAAKALPAKTNVNFLVRKTDWSQKDPDYNRSINKAYANKHGVIDAYSITGEKTIYYDINEIDISPKVTAARIDSYNDISFTTNYPITNDDVKGKITLKQDNNECEVTELKLTDGSYTGSVKIKDKIDLSKKYTLYVEGYGKVDVTLGKIYNTSEYAENYTFDGKLGAVYSKDSTQFTLWSPMAESVKVVFYGKDGKVIDNKPEKSFDMDMGLNGSWSYTAEGDLDGEFYNYIVTIDGKENVVTDPYAKAVGVNGNRAMVVDLSKTNPEGWDKDSRVKLDNPTDSVIYEMHIRDFTIGENSGASIEYAGKYNGVWQKNTTIPGTDVKTGVDHLKELGVNTVHLMPTFDYNTVDETKLDTPQFNWGYDPQNYSVPEGSYSSDPYTGTMRIEEFKKLVKGLHDAGIRVVMDVVYNHTSLSADSNLNLAAPYYYYRENDDFTFSNGSGCGNELASDRTMVRKLIVDSVLYLAEEYHLDGFRFDLMGCIDIDTMKEIRTKLDKIDKDILVYGEGWTGGSSTLDYEKAAFKANEPKFGEMQIAMFSDDIRDGIKGTVFDGKAPGFINGGSGYEETIKFGIVASTKNDQIDTTKVINKTAPWANEPYQTITYVSAHDNLTLWDKLQTSCPSAKEDKLIAMNKMSAAIIYTSQGIPFMQAGEEMARTKVDADGKFVDNSYKSPDSVNAIDWNRKVKYSDLYNYYKGLISLRAGHRAFKMNTTADIQNNLKFLDVKSPKVVAYTLNGKAVGDSWDNIAVVFNANDYRTESITLPSNDWVVVVNGNTAGTSKIKDIKGNVIQVEPKTSYVLVDKESYYRTHPNEKPDEDIATSTPGDNDPGDATSTPGTDKPEPGKDDDSKIPDGEDREEPIRIPDGGDKEEPTRTPGGEDKPATHTPNDDKIDGDTNKTFDGTNMIMILLIASLSTVFVIKFRKRA